jgi:CRISPR-associated exonuclease Cas4
MDLLRDTETVPMLTPSEVIEHVYCPRFTWFMQVQHIDQHEDQRYKVLRGREVHKQRETENKRYLRRKLGVVDKKNEVYLASPHLRMRGVVDEVLWLDDGTMAPLDYKFTEETKAPYKTHRIQALMYGMLIRETYGRPVTRAYVAYIRGANTLHEILVGEDTTNEVLYLIDEIFSILETGRLPRRTANRNRCRDCCYRNICV